MKLFRIICILVILSSFSCTKSEKELLYAKLNYKNRKFNFTLKLPEAWQNYRVMEKQHLVDDKLEVYGLHFLLPTRSRDWQAEDTPARYAALFKILVFTNDQWKYYDEEYASKKSGFSLSGRIIGRSKKYAYFALYSMSIPRDLYIHLSETETVISSFRMKKD